MGEMIEDKQNKILQLNKELEDQRAKVDRVDKQNAKYARELRSAKKVKDTTPEEQDFEIRELREFNKNATKQIGEAVNQYPDIGATVQLYFSQANLPPPATPGAGSASSSRY